MDILIINSSIVLNSVMVNCDLFRCNYDFEQLLPYYHCTAVAAATADC